ncbi:MAG: RDD family protein [Deltaproteobacteria bacterium]|nr:RDD family protein [Deltaproteobacteria bacterium]
MENLVLPSLQAKSSNTPGGFWIRFVAAFIDGFALGFVMLLINSPYYYLLFKAIVSNPENANAAIASLYLYKIFSMVINAVLGYFYMAWFNKNKGGTLGKLALGLRVVDFQTGQNIGYGKSLVRHLGMILNYFTLFIGFIMAGVRQDKRGLHDLIAGTQVIKIR